MARCPSLAARFEVAAVCRVRCLSYVGLNLIDEESPLFGATAEALTACRTLFIVSVIGIDPVIAVSVQTQKDYFWRDIQFGNRFVEIYTDHGQGRLTVDYGRLHETEPAE